MTRHAMVKQEGRARRRARIWAKVSGTSARPRLAVFKSNRYLHAQIIDDEQGKTLLAGTTKGADAKGKKVDAAQALGEKLARQAKAAGITKVVFDRSGFRYTGRVAAFAAALRKAGLIF